MHSPYSPAELMARLEAYAFPPSLAECLVSEQGWTPIWTGKVLDEYRRFLYLAVTAPGTILPSPVVARAWRTHLLLTHDYWEQLCGEVLGLHLHTGQLMELIRADFPEQYAGIHEGIYAYTLELYAYTFKQLPPEEIWYGGSIIAAISPQPKLYGAQLPRGWGNGLGISLMLSYAAGEVFYFHGHPGINPNDLQGLAIAFMVPFFVYGYLWHFLGDVIFPETEFKTILLTFGMLDAFVAMGGAAFGTAFFIPSGVFIIILLFAVSTLHERVRVKSPLERSISALGRKAGRLEEPKTPPALPGAGPLTPELPLVLKLGPPELGPLLALTAHERLPAEVRARLDALHLRAAEVLAYLQQSGQDWGRPDCFLLRQIVEDYAPEAVGAYLKLPSALASVTPLEGDQTGMDLLLEQVDLLLAALQNLMEQAARVNSQPLLAYRRFLQDRFAAPNDELKL